MSELGGNRGTVVRVRVPSLSLLRLLPISSFFSTPTVAKCPDFFRRKSNRTRKVRFLQSAKGYSSENSLGGKGEHFMDSQAVF